MFHKSCRTLPLYWFHKFNSQRSFRPLRSSYSTKATKKLMVSDIQKFKTLLQCTTEGADKVHQVLKSSPFQENDFIKCKNIVEWLNKKGATMADIRNNCHLLQRPFDSIKECFKLLEQMGWKTTDDFLPLLNLTKDEIIRTMANETNRIRIQVYDLSQKCSMEPQTVSEYLAKRPFTFFIRRDLLEQKLEVILSANINPEAILKDLGIFRHGIDRIKSRISFLAESEIECILPWMLNAPENVIKRYLERRRINDLKENCELLAKSGPIIEEICPIKQMIESIESEFPDSDPKEINEISHFPRATDLKIVTKMEKLFKCPTSKAVELYIALERPDLNDLNSCRKKLKWLESKNVSMTVATDNCKILLKPLDKLNENFILLRALNWRAIDDFIPLLALTKKKIIIRGKILQDRIYAIADKLSVKPYHVAKYCIKNSYVLAHSSEQLISKIELLLEYDVMPENILRDLGAMNLIDDVLRSRLEILSTNYIKHIMPWMLRCEGDKFERLIEFRKYKGPQWNYVHDTLIRKLMLHGNTARSLMRRNAFLGKLDSESLNSSLDLLLKHFSSQKIKENIHILEKSMAELNHRIKELQSLNADTLNEIFFVKTVDEFNSFIKIAKGKLNN